MVGSYEIAGLLAAQADMHETARRLVDLANEAGGRDNISVIVIKVTAKAALPAPSQRAEAAAGDAKTSDATDAAEADTGDGAAVKPDDDASNAT
jgi:serine/threonine protein phosphatase PrpC